MIFHLVLLATAAASPVPQGLTLTQFRQGARSLYGGGQEIQVEISPSYRKIRRHGRTQFIDRKDTIKKAASSRQEVYPSARPVFVNAISDEDIEQKIREVNKKELMRKLKEERNNVDGEKMEEVMADDIEEEIEEAMEEAIGEAIEQAINEEIKEQLELAISVESDNVSTQLSPEKIAEEINIIEDMINENKVIQIVTDVVDIEDAQKSEVNDDGFVKFETAPVIIEEKIIIKNIDGFDIGLNRVPETTPVVTVEIPLTSEIIIIEDPVDEESDFAKGNLLQTPKVTVRKAPISSIDFGLIQEV